MSNETKEKPVAESGKESHKKEENINQIVHEISKKSGIKKIKGGELSDNSVITELKKVLIKFKKACIDYSVTSDSIPAAGFSGANSSTMRSSRSGDPITFSYNDVHSGGYYSGSTPYIIQIKVGGALDYKISSAILKVAKELLSKYTYTTELGTSSIRTTDGTNWSSVMLTAPRKNNSYSPLKSLG